MASNESVAEPQTIIVQHRPGTLAGVIACVLAVLGIVVSGIIFVPIAALCAAVALIRALAGGNFAGVGVSVLALVLTAIGFAVTPSLWLLTLALSVASGADRSDAEENAKNERSALARNIDYIASNAQTVNRDASNDVSRFAEVEGQCRSTTATMRSGLERERQMTGNPETALARYRIVIEIEQQQIAMDNRVVRFYDAARLKAETIASLSTALQQSEQSCRVAKGGDSDPLTSACDRISDVRSAYQQNSGQFLRAFANFETVCRQQREEQNRIVTEARRLEHAN
jgi:hypothetical protein